MPSQWFRHPDDGMVYACPGCDGTKRLYERADGRVSCYECGDDCPREDLVERQARSGHTLTKADRQRGGQNSPVPTPSREAARRGGEHTPTASLEGSN